MNRGDKSDQRNQSDNDNDPLRSQRNTGSSSSGIRSTSNHRKHEQQSTSSKRKQHQTGQNGHRRRHEKKHNQQISKQSKSIRKKNDTDEMDNKSMSGSSEKNNDQYQQQKQDKKQKNRYGGRRKRKSTYKSEHDDIQKQLAIQRAKQANAKKPKCPGQERSTGDDDDSSARTQKPHLGGFRFDPIRKAYFPSDSFTDTEMPDISSAMEGVSLQPTSAQRMNSCRAVMTSQTTSNIANRSIMKVFGLECALASRMRIVSNASNERCSFLVPFRYYNDDSRAHLGSQSADCICKLNLHPSAPTFAIRQTQSSVIPHIATIYEDQYLSYRGGHKPRLFDLDRLCMEDDLPARIISAAEGDEPFQWRGIRFAPLANRSIASDDIFFGAITNVGARTGNLFTLGNIDTVRNEVDVNQSLAIRDATHGAWEVNDFCFSCPTNASRAGK